MNDNKVSQLRGICKSDSLIFSLYMRYWFFYHKKISKISKVKKLKLLFFLKYSTQIENRMLRGSLEK